MGMKRRIAAMVVAVTLLGSRVWVLSPEDTAVFKLLFFREVQEGYLAGMYCAVCCRHSDCCHIRLVPAGTG